MFKKQEGVLHPFYTYLVLMFTKEFSLKTLYKLRKSRQDFFCDFYSFSFTFSSFIYSFYTVLDPQPLRGSLHCYIQLPSSLLTQLSQLITTSENVYSHKAKSLLGYSSFLIHCHDFSGLPIYFLEFHLIAFNCSCSITREFQSTSSSSGSISIMNEKAT